MIGIYIRVSTVGQNVDGQGADQVAAHDVVFRAARYEEETVAHVAGDDIVENLVVMRCTVDTDAGGIWQRLCTGKVGSDVVALGCVLLTVPVINDAIYFVSGDNVARSG